MKNLVLFDIDGTLADDRHRYPYVLAGDYEQYFAYDNLMKDPVYVAGRALLEELASLGWDIGYLTARLERNRPATVDWLREQGFPDGVHLFLRPEADIEVRPPRYKATIVADLLKYSGYEDVVLVDNDPHVIARIVEECGERHAFFAAWDQNPETASLSRVQSRISFS